MKLINRRYQLVREISEDYYGTTYEATDLTNKNQMLMIKVLKRQQGLMQMVLNYRESFINYAALEHVNILSNGRFDIIVNIDNKPIEDPLYFYTLEYFDTKTMVDYTSLAYDERMFVMMELCYAIQYLHFRGVRYQYLTFDNIMILKKPNGQMAVKLRDLASINGFLEHGNKQMTYAVQSIAPELMMNKPIDNRTDLYSLGVLMYFLTSGQDAKRVNIEDVKLFSNNTLINDLIYKTIAYDPDDRLEDIEIFIEAFKGICPHEYTFKDKAYYERLNFNTQLIGREKELSIIQNQIQYRLKTMSGHAGVLISGEQGIGKSRLIKEVFYNERILGYHSASIEIEKTDSQDFQVFNQLILDLVKGTPVQQDLIDRFGPELVKIAPELMSMWQVQPSEPLHEGKEQLKLNNRLISFLLEYVTINPLIICLDNIDYLNKNELSVLNQLIVANDNVPLYLVCSFAEMPESLSLVLSESIEADTYLMMDLDRFSIEETALHLKHIMATDNEPMELASLIKTETMGNPRYVEEVVKDLFMKRMIYIHESRAWKIAKDSFAQIQIPDTLDKAIISSLNNYSDVCKQIVNVIALHGKPVSSRFILDMLNLDEKEYYANIDLLLSLKMVQIKFSDFGHSYDFYNRNISKVIYQSIPKDQALVMHLKAAHLIEKDYQKDGNYGDELIYHLSHAGKEGEAAAYAYTLGENMYRHTMFNQALSYYEMSLNLGGDSIGIENKVKLLERIATVHYLVGDLENAYKEYTRLAELSIENNMQKLHIDAQLKLLNIMSTRKSYEGFVEKCDEMAELCKKIDYKEGLLEVGLVKVKYANSTGSMKAVKHLIKSNLDLAYRIKAPYYIGRYLNFKGIEANFSGDFEEAFKCFLSSINYFEQSNSQMDLARAYNNLGWLSMDVMGEVLQARDYYHNALDILKRANVSEGKEVFLSNLGETHLILGDTKEAINLFQQSEALSLETGNVDMQIISTLNLLHAYLIKKEFTSVYRLIQKFNKSYLHLLDQAVDIGASSFHVLCADYYIRMRQFDLAGYHLEQASAEETVAPDVVKQFKLKILKFLHDFFVSGQRDSGDINGEYLRVIGRLTTNAVEVGMFKDFLLDLSLDLMAHGNQTAIDYVMALYLEHDDDHETDAMRIKRTIVMASSEDKPLLRFIDILNRYQNVLNRENQWLLNLMIGRMFAKELDHYQSLSYYLDALDIVHEQSMSIHQDEREVYVLKDGLRRALYQEIHAVIRKISGIDKGQVFRFEAITDLDDYFDLSATDEIFNNIKFKRSIQKAYGERFGIKMKHMDDLLIQFKRDQGYNIKLVLWHLAQQTLAQKGFVYVLDDEGHVEETFGLDDQIEPINIHDFIRQHHESDMGILIENKKRLFSDRLLTSRKSIICMPIFNADRYEEDLNRRRFDASDKGHKEVIGYVYLESEKLLNNINQQSFDMVKQLNNLMYVMLDNYKLKLASTMDKLTGVYLRKHIEREFNKELVDARARHYDVAVIMADIDHFKNVNDTYGHRKGDEVLYQIGQMILNATRSGDYVGRYGGEEFIVILPKTSAMDAYQVCEKIRLSVKDSNVLGDGNPLTISLGISTFPSMGQTEEELIEKADQALYESKNQGRNRSTLYAPKANGINKRYDKLAGILTGNVSNDARVIKAVIDVMDLISEDAPKEVKINKALGVALDITEGAVASLVLGNKIMTKQYERHRGHEELKEAISINKELVKMHLGKTTGEYFIHWNDVTDMDKTTGMPNWKSYIICPLVVNGSSKGLLVITVPIKEKEFDFKHFNFVNQLSGLMAAMLS